MKHLCPVCGWPELREAPRSASGAASFELCPSCGFEFGYDDDDRGVSYEQARDRWVTGGMKWWSTTRPVPEGWDAAQQLARVVPGSGSAHAGPLAMLVGDRCEEIEADFTEERMLGIREREENPHRVEVRRFGFARALLAGGLPAMRMFNRVLNFQRDDVARLDEILAFYEAGGVLPEFEIHPHEGCEVVFESLAKHGFRQTGFHAAFVGTGLAPQTVPDRIVIKPVHTPEEFESFLDAYLRGWGVDPRYWSGARTNMEFWLHRPHWGLYLAEIDGVVAGIAILFLKERSAYLANAVVLEGFRRRGIHSALLAARLRDATDVGCQTIYAHAAWDSPCHRNLLRHGLQLCYTKALWGKAN